MATHDYVIANGSGGAVRSDLNNALAAIVSNNSSATEPTTTYAYMWWADTTSGQLKLRNGADSAWVVIRELDGTMLMESGTAGAPGLAFASDLDTGIYSPGANQLAISTNGVGRLAVAANGNIGVGTVNPTTSLHIRTTGTPLFRIQDDDGTAQYSDFYNSAGQTYYNAVNGAGVKGAHVFFQAGTEAARIDTSGRLGLGTSSPTSSLHVFNPTADVVLKVESGDSISRIELKDSIASNYISTVGTNLDFAINGVAAAMRITSAGNVGIGTTSPTDPLNISSATNQIGLDTGNQAVYGTLDIGHFASGAFIGTQAGSNGGSDLLRFGTSGTERARITSDAEVLIGTEDPIQPTTSTQNGVEINADAKRIKASRDGGAPLTLQRTSSDGDIADFYRDTTLVGSISVTTSATAYNTSSDYRLKENVVALTGAADRVNQLQVHRFNFIADPDTTVDGFLAHEAQAVVPEAVTGAHDEVDADGNPVYQGIDQSKLVPLLTAALQEALAEIESLKARVTALEP